MIHSSTKDTKKRLGWSIPSLSSAVLLLFTALVAGAAPSIPLPVRSSSGQFLIYDPPPAARPAAHTNTPFSAEVIAVSAERIKQAWLSELGLTDQWRGRGHRSPHAGRIHVLLRATSPEEKVVEVIPSFSAGGWQVHIYLPVHTDELRALRALVHALMLEYASRGARERAVEVPIWLTEGLAGQLKAKSSADLILREPAGRGPRARIAASGSGAWLVSRQPGVYYQGRKTTATEAVRRYFSDHPPCSFTELSLPAPRHLDGPGWEIFSQSAQVLVAELLARPRGRASLVQMLELLPKYLNWQFAFFQAFAPDWQSMLDVEKWWALVVANMTGRSAWQAWTPEKTIEKLEEAIVFPVQRLAATNEIPTRNEVTLQAAIGELEFVGLKPYLQRALAQLQLLRTHAAPEVSSLIDRYLSALAEYLNERQQAGFSPVLRGRPNPSVHLMSREMVRQLDRLDAELRQLKQHMAEPSPVAAAP